MTAKEELSQYKYAVKKVEKALEEYQKFQERATKMNTVISKAPQRSNLNSDKVGDNASAMADIEKEYIERWLNAEREKSRLEDRINEITKEPHRTILHARYLEIKEDNTLKDFDEIADEIGYSYSQTTTFHGEALKMYEEKFLS